VPTKQIKKPTLTVKQADRGHPANCISLRPNWERRLKELAAFKKEHGHCNVPRKYSPNPSLANWVSYVRSKKQSGKIAAALVCRLDELGFIWVLRRRTAYRLDWDAMIVALTAFKNQHGHCRVPWQPAKYRGIATWLNETRRRKRKGVLDRGRIRQLDRLGLVWEPNDHKWEVMFADLLAYRAKHGDCNVPIPWPENPLLATWVHGQRRSRKVATITQDHLERLDKLGFVWTRREEVWESKYAALVQYKRTHGHCRVPIESEDHARLGNWVSLMRVRKKQGKLSKERIRRLDELGFVWDAGSKVKRESWDSKYAALVEYQRMHGHCRVPKSHASLCNWVRMMRGYRKRGTLSEERIQRLDALGFVWGVLATWESNYAALVEYQRAYGHCRVPTKSKDHARLGNWVSMMRLRKSQGRLSEERIRRLTQLGFVWDRASEVWDSKYAELVEYQRMHGHRRVPSESEDHARLGSWVSRMRLRKKQGKLSKERIRRLDELGFAWDGTLYGKK